MPNFADLSTTALVNIVIGAILLIFGRRLFWLFVGLIGFLAGFNLAPQLIPDQPNWVILLVAVVIGLLGALLSVFLQRVAVGIAGFLAGGYLVNTLLASLGVEVGAIWWIIYIIGGVIGFILMVSFFDWALIILSSLVGASLIVNALALTSTLALSVFGLLAVIGVAIQAGWMRRYRTRERRRAE